jgi:GTP-binding protein
MSELFAIPNLVLVGKTNVGKSTLFNRLSNMRISIAHATPGATRDCVTRRTVILGNEITVADSGGIEHEHKDRPFQNLVSQRVADFVSQKAHAVLFVVSAKEGISAQDHEIADMLRRSGKPVILVVNKVDHDNNIINAFDCLRFGFSEPLMISAAQKTGLKELRERILVELELKPKNLVNSETPLQLIKSENFRKKKEDWDYDEKELDLDLSDYEFVTDNQDTQDDNDDYDNYNNDESALYSPDAHKISLAVVGRPNAGKSTLVNTLLNEDRVMTSEQPGTTVDAIDTYFNYAGKEICLIDTAGIRRQRSINEEVEKMAVARALCAVDRSNVALLLINAHEGVTEQDKKIGGIIFEKKKACVIAVNKWDEELARNTTKDKFLSDLKFHLPFLAYAPVVFLSAKYGQRVFDVIDTALRIAPRFNKRINTSKLNRSLEKALESHPPPVVVGRRLRMYFATQIDTAPPTFAISCSKPQEVNYSYKRYLVNFFRSDLDLAEVPIRLVFRAKTAQNGFKREN